MIRNLTFENTQFNVSWSKVKQVKGPPSPPQKKKPDKQEVFVIKMIIKLLCYSVLPPSGLLKHHTSYHLV